MPPVHETLKQLTFLYLKLLTSFETNHYNIIFVNIYSSFIKLIHIYIYMQVYLYNFSVNDFNLTLNFIPFIM